MRDAVTPAARLVEGRTIDRRNWHVTLAYIGEFAASRIDELQAIRLSLPVEPFRLRFDRLEFWARPRIAALVAPAVPAGLGQLVAQLRSRLYAAGIETENRRYRPHITIVRNARPFETQHLAQPAITEWAGFELVESLREPGGVTYHPLVKDF